MRCIDQSGRGGLRELSIIETGLKKTLYRWNQPSNSLQHEDEKTFYLRSGANSNIGIFLIFTGAIAVLPLYWLLYYYTLRDVTDWRPALFIALLLILAGLYSIFLSRESITVRRNCIRIDAGLFNKPLIIRWSEEPRLKLALTADENNGACFWELKLIDGRREYTMERLPFRRCELRIIGRHLAKFLSCPFIECDEQGGDTVINAAELNIPWIQRILKNPPSAAQAVRKPDRSLLKISAGDNSFHASWGLNSKGIFAELTVFAAILFASTCLSWNQGDCSFWAECIKRGDFFSYYAEGIILLLILISVTGSRMHLSADRNCVTFRHTLWGVALTTKTAAIDHLEDIRIDKAFRESLIHAFTNEQSIYIRISSEQDARCLHHQLQLFLAEKRPGTDKAE
ncbi:MAG: hypothetical protein AB9903_24560 [Vulcanimicrobiota bacterium]